MSSMTCVHCHVAMSGRKRRFCSAKCSRQHRKPCTADGCDKPTQARGLCSSHYEAWRRSTQRVHVTCEWCGKSADLPKRSGVRKYCGLECTGRARGWSNAGKTPSACRSLAVVPSIPRVQSTQHPAGKGRLTAGRCRVCQSPFISHYSDVTCSETCTRIHRTRRMNQKWHRRRARLSQVQADPGLRSHLVFKRDNFHCHICGKMTKPTRHWLHPRYPTLDHIVPLSRGGEHTFANTATACRLCNSRKSDRLAGDQLALM